MTTALLDEQTIGLKHGAGSRAMRTLIDEIFIKNAPRHELATVGLPETDDGAAIPIGDRWLVLTTDSHVVHPVFFPGGDIGRLAAAGTINDLAMMGACDVLALTCGVIVEEGFPLESLQRIQDSLERTCVEAGTAVVTGDTKVMGRGELDGLVLNTSGVALTDRLLRDSGLRSGDRIIVSGNIGDHGLAILAARNDLGLGDALKSDVAPLNGLIKAALAAGGDAIVASKDPTRGGMASTLSEMATKSGVGIVLSAADLPMTAAARSAAELLGIDPLHVANEGKAVLGVRPEAAEDVLATLREHPLGRAAAIIGTCSSDRPGRVVLDTGFGRRLVSEAEGELLPRIC